MSPAKKLNNGIKAYQEEMRTKTLERIDSAVQRLRLNGLTITKASLAEEREINRSLLYKDFVRIHLLQYPEFNPNCVVEMSDNSFSKEKEMLLSKISNLKCRLSHSQNSNKLLKLENSTLREKNRELDIKYKRLLGKYQTEMSKKIVNFQ